jgi:hypothetical protein
MKKGEHSDRDYELYMNSIHYKGLTHKEKAKYRDIKRKYGLDRLAYDKMYDSQNGLCLGCGQTPKKICVDHCHKTGKVRGLLCSSCNTALGLLRDDPNTLRNLMLYLIRHS